MASGKAVGSTCNRRSGYLRFVGDDLVNTVDGGLVVWNHLQTLAEQRLNTLAQLIDLNLLRSVLGHVHLVDGEHRVVVDSGSDGDYQARGTRRVPALRFLVAPPLCHFSTGISRGVWQK